MTNRFANRFFQAAAAFAALAMVASPAAAQRDPAYQAARTAGQVGEQPDGYLGVVGSQPAAIQKMVDDLNIQRKKAYTRDAPGAGVSIEAYALGTGCKNILNTVPGEKYLTPSGTWQTRTAAAPERDSRCPPA